MRSIRWVMVLAMASVVTSGCSTVQSLFGSGDSAGVDRGRMERMVADDFANALAVLPRTAPQQGALIMSRPETPFGNALLVALRRAGYELEYSDDVIANRYLQYRLESRENQFGTSVGYSIGTDGVTLSRDYNMKTAGVFPISFMRVRGVASDSLVIDDARFRLQSEDETIITGVNADPSLPAVEETVEVAVVDDTPAEWESIPLTEINGQQIVDKSQVSLINMYDARASNFVDFLAAYDSVDREVLVFPNDSVKIPDEARDKLRELRREFDKTTDVFSVVGCSHGPTALVNGNESLAIGRSKIVLEELRALGVSEHQVLDEGCWAGEHFDMMPARGVVVELRRLPEG